MRRAIPLMVGRRSQLQLSTLNSQQYNTPLQRSQSADCTAGDTGDE
jgi:hypothetical protein